MLIKSVTPDQHSLTLVVESNLEDVVEYLLLFNSKGRGSGGGWGGGRL